MRGPHLRIVASCHGCEHVRSTPSTAYRRSYTECGHSEAPRNKLMDNTHVYNSTPQWCPMLKEALHEFTRGNPVHKVNP